MRQIHWPGPGIQAESDPIHDNSCSKVNFFKIASKINKFIFSKRERGFIFPSSFTALAVDPNKYYTVAFS